MDKNSITDVDRRIAEAIQKRSAGPEQYKVTRQDGDEKLVSQPTPPGQIESSVHFSTWKEVDPKPAGIRTADSIVLADEAPVTASEFVVIGNVTISPSGLSGFTKALTKDHPDWVVTRDGNVIEGLNASLAAVDEALLDQQKKARK